MIKSIRSLKNKHFVGRLKKKNPQFELVDCSPSFYYFSASVVFERRENFAKSDIYIVFLLYKMLSIFGTFNFI